jgi:lysophospholipase L1-like esterase
VVTGHHHGRVVAVLRALTALFLVTFAVLGVEIWRAAHRRYLVGDHPLDLSGSYGPIGGRVVRLIMIGDSTAAGVGVDTAAESVGGQLAVALGADGVRVLLSSVAVSGARAHDLAGQLNRMPDGTRADLAVLLVGSNDATHASVPSRVGHDVGAAVRRLLAGNTPVVVGTCPDMGAPPAIDQPMRAILGAFGRRIAAAEAGSVRAAGGVAVDLAQLTGPSFRADHADFASDAFHPSAAGYRLWAQALLPSARRAIGVGPQ